LCLLQNQSKKDKSNSAKKISQENKDFTEKLDVLKHKTIKKVSNDIEEMRFNTAISALMEYTNFIQEGVSNNFKIDFEFYKVLVVMLSPFAPFITEEI
jgi:leucyl-tRNA synthetase